MHPVDAILGLQFGDEGKGKFTDCLACQDIIIAVARSSGGNNCGHTVVVGNKTYKLNHIPSGAISGKISISGNGTVINPIALLEETQKLLDAGIDMSRYHISHKAHLIMPWHIERDRARESASTGKIGTTLKGIGPCYESKIRRTGIRAEDLSSPDTFKAKWKKEVAFDGKPYSPQDAEIFLIQVQSLIPRIYDTTKLIHAIAKTGRILAEGAQAHFLDIDHGTYPYVTSSSCSIGGVCTGLGIPPQWIDKVYGVFKAYVTRVGNGPFLTKMTENEAAIVRNKGNEYGTTTGRPRDIGYLDIPMLRTSCMANGVTHLCITKLDVLSGIKEIKVCTRYINTATNEATEFYPEINTELYRPEYKVFQGWEEFSPTTTAANLPVNCKLYLQYIQNCLKIQYGYISTGPDRAHIT